MVAEAKRWLGSDPVEVGIRIMVIITVFISLFLFIRQSSTFGCQAEYNQAYAKFASNSRDAAELDNKVRNELFRSIYEAGQRHNDQSANDMNAAFVKYFTTVDLTAKQRAENPPPPFPEDFCG